MTKPFRKRQCIEVINIESDSDTTDGETDPTERARRRADKDSKHRGEYEESALGLEDQPRNTGSRSDSVVSHIHTNKILDLPTSENVDTLSIGDILTADLNETWQSVILR